jgi:hypothetical protein
MPSPTVVGATNNTAAATYSSLTCTVPAGVTAGDLILISVNARGSGTVTCTPPAGYIQRVSQARGGSSVHFVFTKIADGTETTAALAFSSTSNHTAVVLLVRGVDQSSPVNIVGLASQSTNLAAHVCPSVTTTAPNTLIVASTTTAISGAFDYTWPVATEAGEADATTGGVQSSISVAWVAQASVGASGTNTANVSSGTGSAAMSTVAIASPSTTPTGVSPFFTFIGGR